MTSPLQQLNDRVLEISSTAEYIRRQVERLNAQEAELNHLAMCSGAMPGDFEVVLVFRMGQSLGRGLVAELR